MQLKIFQMLEVINNRVASIEKNIQRIEEKLDFSIALQRNHLIRIKNGENIDDHMILFGRPYNDLDPQKAWEIFQDEDTDFILLDVSKKSFQDTNRISQAVCIPLEDLNNRYPEIQSKTIPIMVISELGLRSIQACEMLIKKGHFNISNISGGHKFWPGNQTKSHKLNESA